MITLTHVADLVVTVGKPVVVGVGPRGLRRVIPITGGTVSGAKLSGRVLPGGADFQIVRGDGVTELEARYVIETNDGALIYIENCGLRHGPVDVMDRLNRGEAVDPALIYFRTTARFETAAEPYLWVTKQVFVGEGNRRPDSVEIAFYQVS
jgi:hypothetical protein